MSHKDEFPCKQRKNTKEYRSGWDAIWGDKENAELISDSPHPPERICPPSSFSFGRPKPKEVIG